MDGIPCIACARERASGAPEYYILSVTKGNRGKKARGACADAVGRTSTHSSELCSRIVRSEHESYIGGTEKRKERDQARLTGAAPVAKGKFWAPGG